MLPRQSGGRSHGSVRHQRTSTEELRARGAWSSSLLASGPPLEAKGANLSRPAEAPDPGRDHPGMVGDIISERWAELSRNGGRHHSGIVGDIDRSPHTITVPNGESP